MTVQQLIKILEQIAPDREVVIHTIEGADIPVKGYLIPKDMNNNNLYLTDFKCSTSLLK